MVLEGHPETLLDPLDSSPFVMCVNPRWEPRLQDWAWAGVEHPTSTAIRSARRIHMVASRGSRMAECRRRIARLLHHDNLVRNPFEGRECPPECWLRWCWQSPPWHLAHVLRHRPDPTTTHGIWCPDMSRSCRCPHSAAVVNSG